MEALRMWLWMALGIIVVAGLVIWLFWSVCINQNKTNTAGTQNTAIDVLKQRYARGEINKEQFEEMRRNVEA